MKVLNVEGFKVLYHKKSSPITSVRILVNAGACNEETPDVYGSAHFLEHMFFKGTKSKSVKEVNKITSELGSANAYTASNRTVYRINCLNENFSKSLNILSEMLFEAEMTEEEFNKERGVILEEIQTELDSPSTYFFTILREQFLGTPAHRVLGHTENISKITLDELKQFRSK